MALPGYALMELGTRIHITAWPGMDSSRHSFLSQTFASQAAAYVIDVGTILAPEYVTNVARRIIDEQSELQRNQPGI